MTKLRSSPNAPQMTAISHPPIVLVGIYTENNMHSEKTLTSILRNTRKIKVYFKLQKYFIVAYKLEYANIFKFLNISEDCIVSASKLHL